MLALGRRLGVPAALFAIVVVFVAASLFGIADESLWLDESESWMWAIAPIGELTTIAGQSNHAPTYYAALHGWIKLGGDSDAWMRALSTAFMACSIPVAFLLGQVVHSRKAGIVAALLFASSPLVYEFSQEARPYSLLTLSGGVSVLLLAVGIKQHIVGDRHPALIGLGWSRGQAKDDLIWLAMLAALLVAITTHHTALLLLPILGGTWFVLIALNPHRIKHAVNLLIFTAALSAIYGAFFLPGFLESFGTFKQTPVSLRDGLFYMTIIYGNGRVIFANVLFIVPVLAALGHLVAHRQWTWAFFLFATCLGMLALVLLVGEIHGSVLKWRTFMWVATPYAVLLAWGLVAIRPRWLVWALLAGIVSYNVLGMVMVHESSKQPWQRVAQHLERLYEPGDGILACPGYNHKSLFRYWSGPTDDMWGYNSRTTKEVYPMSVLSANWIRHIKYPNVGVTMMPDFRERYDRIWVVASWHPECRDLGERVVEEPFGRRMWSIIQRLQNPDSSLVINKLERHDPIQPK